MKSINGFIIGITLTVIAISANAASLPYNSTGAGHNVTMNYPGHTGSQVFAGALNRSLTGAPAAAVTAANNYLSPSIGQTGPATWFQTVNGERQDLVGPSNTVPEPQTLFLLGAAFLPMPGFCRRRK